MFENQELEQVVKDLWNADSRMGVRSAITRVLELARDAQCEWCEKGRPIIKHKGLDWHPNRVNSTTPWWPCSAIEIRDLMKVKP